MPRALLHYVESGSLEVSGKRIAHGKDAQPWGRNKEGRGVGQWAGIWS
jgi:hypothetical protein